MPGQQTHSQLVFPPGSRLEREQLMMLFVPQARDTVRALLIDDDPADRTLFNRLSTRSKQLDIVLHCCSSIEQACFPHQN